MIALKTLIIFTIFCTISIFSQNKTDYPSVPVTQPIPNPQIAVNDSVLYGNQLDPAAANVLLSDLIANPSSFEGKTINVKGEITDVCQEAGCWSYITDGTNYMMVQTLHKFFLPKDATGKLSADGVFKLKEFSEEHAKAILKESKNPRMKEEEINGPQKVYVLEATGIMVYSK